MHNSSVFRGMIQLPTRRSSSTNNNLVISVDDRWRPLQYLFDLLGYDPAKPGGGPISIEAASTCREMARLADKYDVSIVMGVLIGTLWESVETSPIRVLPVAVELGNQSLAEAAVKNLGYYTMDHPANWSLCTAKFIGLQIWHALIAATNSALWLSPKKGRHEVDLEVYRLEVDEWETVSKDFTLYVTTRTPTLIERTNFVCNVRPPPADDDETFNSDDEA